MSHITDLQLYKENNNYYLSALITHEDKNGVYKVSIPRIKFPVASECIINHTRYPGCSTIVSLDFGLGELYAEPVNENDHYFTITCLEEKVHEMTLAEIERELGYKIKLKENKK